jgi:hypothetical protein
MLRPVSPRVCCKFRRPNRLPYLARFTVSSLSSSEVSLPHQTITVSRAYDAKLFSKPATLELPNAPSVAYAAVTHPLPGPAPSSKTRETIALAKDYILPVYARPPIVLDRGQGSWVWDCDGRKYLDFSAGIAVNALGHADEGVSEASYSFTHRLPVFWTNPISDPWI